MKIDYDIKRKIWCSPFNQNLTLGSNLYPLKTVPKTGTDNTISFPVNICNNNAGPLIGILAGRERDGSIVGNGELFKVLQKEVLKNGGISFVFTPKDIKEQEIDGFIYVPAEDKWFPAVCPLPHIVFNRVPFRRLEKTHSFEKAVRFFQKNQIPFFNPCFLNKYELFRLFIQDPIISPYLPDTMLVSEKTDLLHFLERYKRIYLKPIHGAKGRGIFKACLAESNSIELFGLEQEKKFRGFHDFWNIEGKYLIERSYIAQEAVSPSLLNGKRFDFRILVHLTDSIYQVTGIGIRQSKDQEITTHIPNGGILIPYQQIQTKQHDEFFAMIADHAGGILTKEKGLFGEFSIDAGITADNKYVIYEINSKPMCFDEQEIESKRLQALVRLFTEKAGFKVSMA